MTGGLLILAMLAPAAPPPCGLQKGDELTFTGTVEEAVDRPGLRFRRKHDLEIRLLVLERPEKWVDVAVVTLLRRAEDVVAGAVGDITGGVPRHPAPPAVRLDLVRVHADGTAHLLFPVGPPPLMLNGQTPARTLPAVPLDSFAPFEFGMFAPRPPASAPDMPWTIASTDRNRPAEVWQLQKHEFVNAERCALLVMNQQSPTWEKPVGGTTAWHRADAVWVSTLDGTARKVYRVIRHRDGLATELAAWVAVQYELKDQTRHAGRTFDRYRRDVETAFATAAEVVPFLADAARQGARFLETRLNRLDIYLQDSDTTSPYRECVLAVRRQLDAARRGDSGTKVALVEASLGTTAKKSAWPEPGQLAPDFTAGSFRLAEQRGKPIVLVFFKPGSDTTDLALAIAEALHVKYGSRAAIVPLTVSGNGVSGGEDQKRRQRTVPIFHGAQAEATYDVESVPRFVVIDSQGVVRWTFAGVGAETGYSVRVELERLLPASSPGDATGTTRMPEPNRPAPVRHP